MLCQKEKNIFFRSIRFKEFSHCNPKRCLRASPSLRAAGSTSRKAATALQKARAAQPASWESPWTGARASCPHGDHDAGGTPALPSRPAARERWIHGASRAESAFWSAEACLRSGSCDHVADPKISRIFMPRGAPWRRGGRFPIPLQNPPRNGSPSPCGLRYIFPHHLRDIFHSRAFGFR